MDTYNHMDWKGGKVWRLHVAVVVHILLTN